MKKILGFLMAAAVLFGASSCVKEDISSSLAGGEVEVTLTANLAELGTRAIGDGTSATNLYVAIYEAGTENQLSTEIINPEQAILVNGKTANVRVVLLKDKLYDLVFWAQSPNATCYTRNWAARNIEVNYEGAVAQDENRDAFFGVWNNWRAGHDGTTFELRRPFAQLNAGLSQDDVINIENNKVSVADLHAAVTVKKIANILNLGSDNAGTVSGEAEVTFASAAKPTQALTVDGVAYNYLSMSYLLVNTKQNIDVTYSFVENGAGEEPYVRPYYQVPVQRNYRTNIIGNLISSPMDFTVIIVPEFEGEHNRIVLTEPAEISTGEQLIDLLNTYNTVIGDININAPVEALGTSATVGANSNVVIDMNNQAVATGGGSTGAYGLRIEKNSTVVVNEANLTLGGISTFDGSNLTFNEGQITVNTTNTSQRYRFYASGENTVVTINGGTFPDPAQEKQHSYVCAAYGAVVYINGGDFGVAPNHKRWKHPMYEVEGEIIIRGGSFGFDPTEWVDAGYKADKVGNKWYVVPANSVAVNSAEGMAEAIQNGQGVFLLNDIVLDDVTNAYTVAKGQDITLYLNGHDIVATSTTAEHAVIFTVNGSLNVKGNGTISLTGDNFAWNTSYRYAAINVRETGVVTLGEGVNVVCEASKDGSYGMCYAVDIYTTGTLNINGASLHSNYIAVRCFFGNSVVNVGSGSTITSSKNNYGIWLQSSPGAVVTIAEDVEYTVSNGIYIFG